MEDFKNLNFNQIYERQHECLELYKNLEQKKNEIEKLEQKEQSSKLQDLTPEISHALEKIKKEQEAMEPFKQAKKEISNLKSQQEGPNINLDILYLAINNIINSFSLIEKDCYSLLLECDKKMLSIQVKNLIEKCTGFSQEAVSIVETQNRIEREDLHNLDLKNKETDQSLKERYGNSLLYLIIGEIVFIFALIFSYLILLCYGVEIPEAGTLMIRYIALGIFAQSIGLVIIILKSVFDKNKEDKTTFLDVLKEFFANKCVQESKKTDK